ncbi:MAG TPA: hypothetical protein VK498_01390, partial [Ferruginibacter sp.]|nr:hypothetical protein [Ferruginibacter sp.]
MKKNYRIIVIFFYAPVLISCTDIYDICDLPRGVTLQGGFYQKVNGVVSPATAPYFSLYTLGSSTAIYSNQQNISRFGVGLNPLIDSASYSISLGGNYIADTIT